MCICLWISIARGFVVIGMELQLMGWWVDVCMHLFHAIFFPFLVFYMSVCFRGDDCWANDSPVHGWDIDRFRQLDDFPDCEVSESVLSRNGGNNPDVAVAACPWNISAVWWYHFIVRRSGCVPWAKRKCFGVFPRLRFQVSRTQGHCWFLAGGKATTIFVVVVALIIHIQPHQKPTHQIMCLNCSSGAQSTSKLRPRSPNWCELNVL